MNRQTTRSFPAAKKRPPSRFARLLDFVIRHAGAVAVDPVHMLPLDPITAPLRPHRPARQHRRG